MRQVLAWSLLWRCAAVVVATNGTAPRCGQCSEGPRVHASSALDAFAMGALASLVYVSEWSNMSRSFEVASKPLSPRMPLLMRWRERFRWVECVARRARRTPHPAGVMLGFPALRDGSSYRDGRLPSRGVEAACAKPFERRWSLAYFFGEWYEPGPAKTKWHATTCLVARGSDGAVAVAFMGSSDARHAVTNLQLLQDHGARGEGRTLRGAQGPNRVLHCHFNSYV